MARAIGGREHAVGRPAEAALAVYLLIGAVSCLLLRPPGWILLLAGHLVAAGGLAALTRIHDSRIRLLRAFRTLLPFASFGPLYALTERINRTLPVWVLNGPLERFEGWLFGGQPSLFLADRFDSLPLSEFLHACYFGYYSLIPLVPIVLLARGEERRAAGAVGALTYCFLLCLFFYVWLPATSPLYMYELLGPPMSEGFFFSLTHHLAEEGGIDGGAFPSSHAAISTLALLLARRHARGLFWVMLLPTLGLLVATVYGRYHFAVDTLSGILLAALIAWIWPRLRQ